MCAKVVLAFVEVILYEHVCILMNKEINYIIVGGIIFINCKTYLMNEE